MRSASCLAGPDPQWTVVPAIIIIIIMFTQSHGNKWVAHIIGCELTVEIYNVIFSFYKENMKNWVAISSRSSGSDYKIYINRLARA